MGKYKVGYLYKKPIVTGDKNLVTKDEIHTSELSGQSNGGESTDGNYTYLDLRKSTLFTDEGLYALFAILFFTQSYYSDNSYSPIPGILGVGKYWYHDEYDENSIAHYIYGPIFYFAGSGFIQQPDKIQIYTKVPYDYFYYRENDYMLQSWTDFPDEIECMDICFKTFRYLSDDIYDYGIDFKFFLDNEDKIREDFKRCIITKEEFLKD